MPKDCVESDSGDYAPSHQEGEDAAKKPLPLLLEPFQVAVVRALSFSDVNQWTLRTAGALANAVEAGPEDRKQEDTDMHYRHRVEAWTVDGALDAAVADASREHRGEVLARLAAAVAQWQTRRRLRRWRRVGCLIPWHLEEFAAVVVLQTHLARPLLARRRLRRSEYLKEAVAPRRRFFSPPPDWR